MNSSIHFSNLEGLDLLRESVDLECKLAAGKSGNGALPKDFWPSYSAMANTDGGFILLGVREKKGRFLPAGVSNLLQVRKTLVDLLANPQKASVNLLTDQDLETITLDGKDVLVVRVPRATRKQRPVFVNGNPLTGSYRRFDEADQVIPEDEVKFLLSEQSQDSLDFAVLPQFGMHDLSLTTLESYRQRLALRQPEHPWNELEHNSFLREAGAWRRDRDTGEEGLTIAGLLMFGKFQSIQDHFPNYALDYQERPEAKTEKRWIDRIWLDGSWSGNLFDFYRMVYPKLIEGLKIPFELKDGIRKGEDAVHEAIREALANTLIHADYRQKCRLLIVKRPDMVGFQNPGLMRIPIEVALAGEEPDARNKRLAHLFGFVGIGEKAGTGIPKILSGWRGQHWRRPSLSDTQLPSPRTILSLQMLDLFPEGILKILDLQFGERFEVLDHTSRTALAIALSEGRVNHARLVELLDVHASDVTKALRELVAQNFLMTSGTGKGTIYRFPGVSEISPTDIFEDLVPNSLNLEPSSPNLSPSSLNLDPNSPNLDPDFPNLDPNSPNLNPSSSNLKNQSANRDDFGRLVTDSFKAPFVDRIETLKTEYLESLQEKAVEPRSKKKIPREEMIEAILDICEAQFVRLECLAELLDRKPSTLQGQYLTQLCRDRKLRMAFQDSPNHPHQAYTSL